MTYLISDFCLKVGVCFPEGSGALGTLEGKQGKGRRGSLIHYYFPWTATHATDEIYPGSPGLSPFPNQQNLRGCKENSLDQFS